MKSRPMLLALAPLVLACAQAQAGRLVDVQIVDRDSGATLPQYSSRAKHYIAGAPGHRYSVRIVNTSAQRVLTVLSVDGVNAISGETASAQQSGYVLDPYESTEIAGWRKNMNEIAAFEFTTLSDSYAAQTGRPNNVGVIGVAVYRERVPPPPPPPVYRDDRIAQDERERAGEAKRAGADAAATSAPRPAAPAASQAPAVTGAAPDTMARRADKPAAEESLGTGHGARESSHASYTSFQRDSVQPYEVVSIWYDSYAKLQARGIVPRQRPNPKEPQPFPNEFTPDPPSHR